MLQQVRMYANVEYKVLPKYFLLVLYILFHPKYYLHRVVEDISIAEYSSFLTPQLDQEILRAITGQVCTFPSYLFWVSRESFDNG